VVTVTLNVVHLFHSRTVILNHDPSEHLTNLPYLDTSLNFPSRKKSTFYFRSHSRTTIPTSSELWNRRLPKGCFSGPNKRQSDGTRSGLQGGYSRTFQQNYCNKPCVRRALLHCYAKASHHVSGIPGLFLRI